MTTFNDRPKIVQLLQTVTERDRTVIEFQKKGDEIHAMDITNHVEVLEERDAE